MTHKQPLDSGQVFGLRKAAEPNGLLPAAAAVSTASPGQAGEESPGTNSTFHCRWCGSGEKHDRRVCRMKRLRADRAFNKATIAATRAGAAIDKADRYAAMFRSCRPADGRVYRYLMAMCSGLSAAEAAERFGTTRSTILGCIHRFKERMEQHASDHQ